MDWDALLKEATQYLQDYIRIETVNPPGNEIEGARFLKKILEAESIPCEIFEPAPGKGSLLGHPQGRRPEAADPPSQPYRRRPRGEGEMGGGPLFSHDQRRVPLWPRHPR